MYDFLGFNSVALVCIITFFLGLFRPDISRIIFVALILRVTVLLIGHYLVALPDSTADAISFERIAWELAQDGFFSVIDNYGGPGPKFICWLIAIPYSLFGRSILMAKSLSLFFGIGCVFLGWQIAKIIWNNHVANKVGWAIALFPSLILYSVLIMREMYVVFFLLIALYGVVIWTKTENFKSFIIIIFGFTGSIFFHGAMLIGAVTFMMTVGITTLKKLYKSLFYLRLNIKTFIFFLIFVFCSAYYLSNKISVSYLGSFSKVSNLDFLLSKTQISTRGDASFPEWTKINSKNELIYKAPIRSIYFIFSPFPWDVKKPSHLIGMFESFLYMYLFFLILCNIKSIWKDPTLRVILIILLVFIIAFGIGVGNFGTGIRHRSKLVVMMILLAAPLIRGLSLKKIRKKYK
jgi:4-amino-4-deoxy-L-arabinose transferase-like glycosyltransferase|tara:strand:+ start:20729 stop:21946 length:1218 start_codon:yes stop_codon:yes gene_type:complete